MYIFAFFFPLAVIAFITTWHSQSGLTEVMDGLAEGGTLVVSVSLDVMCGHFSLRVIGKGSGSGAITLAAASPARFNLKLCLSPEIILSPQCV